MLSEDTPGSEACPKRPRRAALFFPLVVLSLWGCSNAPQEMPTERSKVAVSPEVVYDPAFKASETESKKKLLYHPNGYGRFAVQDALLRVKEKHKRILIEWGANSCSWCYKLHDVFENNPQVKKLLDDYYEVLYIDTTTNMPLAGEYKCQFDGIPYLTILDDKNHVVVNQSTVPLQDGNHHDPARVTEFLEKWKPL